MPKIPQIQASSQLRTGAARIDPGAATAVSRAATQLGQQASRLASQALTRQRQADDAAFVTERTNRLLRNETQLLADAETRGSEVDLEGLQEQYQSRVQDLSKDAPSDEALSEFKLQADNAFSRKFFPGYAKHQSGLNIQKRVRSFESGLDDIQSEVLTGRTDVAEAVARTEAALVGLEATSAGVVDIEKARINAFNEIATNSLGGRIDRGDGVAVIEEIKAGQWDKLTDSGTLARILSAAEKDVKQRTLAEKKKFAEGLDDYVAFLSSGKDDEGMAARFSPDNVNATFGDKGPKINEQISDARQFGQDLNEIKTATPEELNSIVENAKPSSPSQFRREAKQFDILGKAINARNKAIADDPAKYTLQNSDVTQKSFQNFAEAFESGDAEATELAAREYAATSRAQQEELGVHSQGVQLLPKEFEDQLATQLNDFRQGGENVALQIDGLKQAFGREWQTVQRQLQQNKKMGAGLRVMAGMDFGPEMVRLGEALATPQKDYKEVVGDDNFKDIRKDTIEELEDFQNTLRGQPGSEQAFIQHKTAIETLAMKYMADGAFDDTSDAIEQAKSDVLDSRFAFVDTYRVPTKFNADNVENGVDDTIDKLKSGEFDLMIPESATVQNPEDRKEVYLSVLRPTPITEPNGNGIMFTDQNGNAILKSDGDPVIVPFKELSDFAVPVDEIPSSF